MKELGLVYMGKRFSPHGSTRKRNRSTKKRVKFLITISIALSKEVLLVYSLKVLDQPGSAPKA